MLPKRFALATTYNTTTNSNEKMGREERKRIEKRDPATTQHHAQMQI